MATLLHMDVSARVERSLTRSLSYKFIKEWQNHRPQDQVITRDLGKNSPPAITENWIRAVFTSPNDLTTIQKDEISLSDKLLLSRCKIRVLKWRSNEPNSSCAGNGI